ncbi:MAG: cytochrome C, partial [Methylophilaceae bacterium]
MLGNKFLKSALFVSMLAFAALSLQANAACNFVSTKDGSAFKIKATDTDTPEAKEFLETCKNPYTAKYAADAEAAKAGKKVL